MAFETENDATPNKTHSETQNLTYWTQCLLNIRLYFVYLMVLHFLEFFPHPESKSNEKLSHFVQIVKSSDSRQVCPLWVWTRWIKSTTLDQQFRPSGMNEQCLFWFLEVEDHLSLNWHWKPGAQVFCDLQCPVIRFLTFFFSSLSTEAIFFPSHITSHYFYSHLLHTFPPCTSKEVLRSFT